MELRHLKYFVAVTEDLSFNRAASRLYISQPALSRQIKDLENELGVALFLRKSDGLRLTEAGAFLLEQAKDILQRSQAAIQSTQARYANIEKPLRVGYIPTILQSFLGEALHSFGLACPQVPIQLQEMPPVEQIKALREAAIDVAFIGYSPSELDAEFTVQCVKQVPIAALLPATHRLANQDSLRLIELAEEKFIGMAEENFPKKNDFIREFCQRAGFTVNLHKSADSLASMVALVAAGQGVAIVPSEAVALLHSNVVFVLLDPPVYARSTAIWRKGTPSPCLNSFLEVLPGLLSGAENLTA